MPVKPLNIKAPALVWDEPNSREAAFRRRNIARHAGSDINVSTYRPFPTFAALAIVAAVAGALLAMVM